MILGYGNFGGSNELEYWFQALTPGLHPQTAPLQADVTPE